MKDTERADTKRQKRDEHGIEVEDRETKNTMTAMELQCNSSGISQMGACRASRFQPRFRSSVSRVRQSARSARASELTSDGVVGRAVASAGFRPVPSVAVASVAATAAAASSMERNSLRYQSRAAASELVLCVRRDVKVMLCLGVSVNALWQHFA